MHIAIAFLLLLACGCSSPRHQADLRPARWVSREAGVSFELPTDPGWEVIPVPDELVIQRTDKTAYVEFFTAATRPAAETLDEAFLKLWDRGHYKDRELRKLSAEFFTFKGKPAYKVEDHIPGTKRRYTTIVWLEGSRLFQIEATKHDGDPFGDSVIQKLIDSMEFLPQSAHDS